jgi:hypothetical protein
MTRRDVLCLAGTVVAVAWSRMPATGACRGAVPAQAPPPRVLVVDHQGWIVRATDRDALEARLARRAD